jgi:hypothetical protein
MVDATIFVRPVAWSCQSGRDRRLARSRRPTSAIQSASKMRTRASLPVAARARRGTLGSRRAPPRRCVRRAPPRPRAPAPRGRSRPAARPRAAPHRARGAACLEALEDALGADARDEEPAVDLERDEPVAGEPPQRLADRAARDAEGVRKLRLTDARARREPPVDDHRAELVVHQPDDGPDAKRPGSRSAHVPLADAAAVDMASCLARNNGRNGHLDAYASRPGSPWPRWTWPRAWHERPDGLAPPERGQRGDAAAEHRGVPPLDETLDYGPAS